MCGRAFVSAGMIAVALAGCRPSIGELTARPRKYYQEQIVLKGRVSRIERVAEDTLLELEDASGRRAIVAFSTPVDVRLDAWVKVVGALVPERRVGGRIVYDVIAGQTIAETRAPLLPNLL